MKSAYRKFFQTVNRCVLCGTDQVGELHLPQQALPVLAKHCCDESEFLTGQQLWSVNLFHVSSSFVEHA